MAKAITYNRANLNSKDIFNSDATVKGHNINYGIGEELDRDAYCYTFMGQHDYLDEDDNPVVGGEDAEDSDIAFAKKVITDNSTRFFIKTGPEGMLFNPFGIDEWTHNKTRHHTDKKRWEYKEVNERSFGFYMKFLKTKNTANYKNAERETF